MDQSAYRADKQGVQGSQHAINVPVWVQCNGYRCMAVLNYKGEWRTYPNYEPLSDIIQVLGEFPEA